MLCLVQICACVRSTLVSRLVWRTLTVGSGYRDYSFLAPNMTLNPPRSRPLRNGILHAFVVALSTVCLVGIIGVISSGALDGKAATDSRESRRFHSLHGVISVTHHQTQSVGRRTAASKSVESPRRSNATTAKVNASLSSATERVIPKRPPPFPRSADTARCSLENCQDFLSHHERLILKQCTAKTMKKFRRIQSSSCRFLSNSSRQPVALASAEGSGNTWLRSLLEKATGVCTGFSVCDPELRMWGFPGEGISSGKVVVAKTHIIFPQWVGVAKKLAWEGSYGSAVVLVRNPALALIAEWNRRVTNSPRKRGAPAANSHTHVVSEEAFSMFSYSIQVHSL